MKPFGDAEPTVQIVIRVSRCEEAQLSRHRICFHKVGKVLKVTGRLFDRGGLMSNPERALFLARVGGGMRLSNLRDRFSVLAAGLRGARG